MTVTSMRRWVFAALLAATGLGGWWGLQQASAGKPGGGVTHTSTIYYDYQNATYKMYEDGSGKTRVSLPPGFGVPSSKVYGGSRWWLAAADPLDDGHWELFAVREDGSPPVQLTDCGPGGVHMFGGQPTWSNDRQDTFVSVNATADLDVDGQQESYLIRLPIIGDIGAMESAGLLPLTAADCEFITSVAPEAPADYACSSDPSQVAYLVFNYNAGSYANTTIWVRTLPDVPGDDPVDVPIFTAQAVRLSPWSWSHDGTRIAFYTWNTSTYGYGGTWTIRPDGSGLLKVISNTNSMNYLHNAWSPDSSELLIETIKTNVQLWNYQYNLARMPAGGGKLTILTSDLNGYSGVGSSGTWFSLP